MDNDLAIIFGGSLLILVVLGITLKSIVDSVLSYKREQNETRVPQNLGEINMIAERTQMIEDRLHILERIATDRGHMLADEIDALRSAIPHETEKAKERG